MKECKELTDMYNRHISKFDNYKKKCYSCPDLHEEINCFKSITDYEWFVYSLMEHNDLKFIKKLSVAYIKTYRFKCLKCKRYYVLQEYNGAERCNGSWTCERRIFEFLGI